MTARQVVVMWRCSRCTHTITTFLRVTTPPSCTCGNRLKPKPMTGTPIEKAA